MWAPDTPEASTALEVFVTEDAAAAAAVAQGDCVQPLIWEMTSQPSWWDEGTYGPWEHGWLLSCPSIGIVWPTIELGLATLAELLYPGDWSIVPPG